MRYWLFKSEADCYSIQDLSREKKKTTFWDGVRNYQARNFLRDDVRKGDRVFFYHSHADPLAIVGLCEVVKEAYADHTAFDPEEKHYDAKSKADDPTWYMVDIKLLEIFDKPLARDDLKSVPELKEMELLKRGSRLSIQPVSDKEAKTLLKLAGSK